MLLGTRGINSQLTFPAFWTLAKAVVVGFLSGEIMYLALTTGAHIYRPLDSEGYEIPIIFACALSTLGVAGYLLARESYLFFLRFVRSCRADVWLMLVFGVSIAIAFGGTGSQEFSKALSKVAPIQLLLLVSIPFLAGLTLLARAAILSYLNQPKSETPFFISDTEKKTKDDDLLEFAEAAERFSERVLNGNSRDSIVFGVDAPWGIGKSTFVNLCIEYWEQKHRNAVIVYNFNLLRYEDRKQLLEKFIDGLVRTIQKQVFLPELRPLLNSYSRFLKGKGNVSLLGLDLELLPGSYTIDDAFEDLDGALAQLNRKVIIVVDDLDRMNFETIKDVLFAIRKTFTLPNVSYVLCYDTENIIDLDQKEKDPEKIIEFLEKFVNVKASLFLHTETLTNYITTNFDKAVKGNLQLDPLTVEKTKQAISTIRDMYKSNDFHMYQSLIGDIRKLKRLINTLLLFEIEKTDFENSDFDKSDLIHLLLIYINYPSVFRKIFNTETDGRRGFFSLVQPHDDEYPDKEAERGRSGDGHYMNSTKFNEYLKRRTPNQIFLLKKLFSPKTRLKNTRIESVEDAELDSYACFNGDRYGRTNRNLEKYLNLIVRLSKPLKQDEQRFYRNAKDNLINGTSFDTVLQADEFSYSKPETNREQLWRTIVNSADEFPRNLGQSVILHLLHHITDYSHLENEKVGVGLRDNLAFFLIKLLDSCGWVNPNNAGRRDNTDENVAEIADWIFGVNAHREHGVLRTLGSEKRGALGLYDLMIFRLYCCADRGGTFFNLQNALCKHGDPNAPTTGVVSQIVVAEMREMSQEVFRIFRTNFIEPGVNLLAAIDNLSLSDLSGRYFRFVSDMLLSKQVSAEEIDQSVSILKSRMKAFITYQLGNSIVSSGVGCGYYDETGKGDNHGIARRISEYMFSHCFNPETNAGNYEYFVDYLLSNFASKLDDDDGQYRPTIREFTKILDRDALAEYWKRYSSAIKALNLPGRDKKVITGNYAASYSTDLEAVYKILDQLVASLVE